VDEKTVRKRVWKYVQAIAALKGMMLPVLAFNHKAPPTLAILDCMDRI
jgi:hypothetical protein